MTTIFHNARIFDGMSRASVSVDGTMITAFGEATAGGTDAVHIDCAGRTLLPWLIDAHVHIIANRVDLSAGKQHLSYLHAQAVTIMGGMLDRGFTTVRDGGGADAGFVAAVEEGHIRGPRLNISGLALSQTGGHGDMRSTLLQPGEPANHCIGSLIGRIADGVPEVRAWKTYVMAHAYTPAAIIAVIEAGGRTIEHGNLIDEPTALLMKERGAYLVPTLVASDVLTRFGEQYGFSAASMDKIRHVYERGLQSVALARRCGVKLGFGTDILGIELHPYQGEEFTLRAKVEPTVETLLSATSVNAEMMMLKDRLGVIKPGAEADLLVVDGDPTEDPTVFTRHGANIRVIMKAGTFYKNDLN